MAYSNCCDHLKETSWLIFWFSGSLKQVLTELVDLSACTVDLFHNNFQCEVKYMIPFAATNLHRIIMLQLHVQNNFIFF